ncbi:uncharacterized protein [Amphiura filiformis]|uniref:uncharacterized protein n=1 Tax=Amphiura filiformis TaxID=82378 RepID=UPI003B218506
MVKYLISQGARVDEVDQMKATALHMAVFLNHSQICEELLQHMKESDIINAVDELGNTALHHAVHQGNNLMCALLVKNKARTDVLNKEHRTVIEVARANHPDLLPFLKYKEGDSLGSLLSMRFGSDNDPLDEMDSGSTPDSRQMRHHDSEEVLHKIEPTKEHIKARQKVVDGKLGSSDVSGSDVPDSNVPDSDVPNSNVPDSDVPNSNVPDSDVPNSDVPDSDVPNSSRTLSPSSVSLQEANLGEFHEHQYDFSLWFAKKNTKEADVIFKVLEEEQGLRGFRYDRDGRPRMTSYEAFFSEGIQKSRKVLHLVSPEALEDVWFNHHMISSLTPRINQSKGNVIPILLRMSRKGLPSYLSSVASLSYPKDSTSSSKWQQESPNSTSNKDEFNRFVDSLIRICNPPVAKIQSNTTESISRLSEYSSSYSKSRKNQSPTQESQTITVSNLVKKEKT